ncbi:hypothetical protein [Halocatena marina]|nr:hypothetical protein [Halocatena marina]
MTTPRLLKAFVVHGDLSRETSENLLGQISRVRSWNSTAYVQQTTHLFD